MSLVTASGKREVQDQELERGARYSDLLSTPPGQALLSPDQNGFGLTWLALAALLALVGWLALRRR
jgi:LPXTG-motif cell wall-anchored protein